MLEDLKIQEKRSAEADYGAPPDCLAGGKGG